MKYIVIGLGGFGASLAQYLTNMGHEVIAIDNRMEKVDFYKDKITHTICMDATDLHTLGGLPIKDTDMIVVAIGEEHGASIMCAANLKTLGAKKIIGRAISSVHETVLHAIGVETIIRPEKESARKWSKKLSNKHLEETFELNKEYSITEVRVPKKYDGKTIAEVDFRNNYNLVALTTAKEREIHCPLGGHRMNKEVYGVAQNNTILNMGDIIVVYGKNRDIEKFLHS
ncbi:TrkA family potassium uptake protein [Ornithobacterium rhinotracheale]|uniref:potassium channel family protein n=1 Tax=Ornithobacterium rhinotracheale TaxID=28251 RepID=UPI00129C5D60|nr:TrkA family potassium uptake protein [Ornithobacterium rhinotracheale]MRJ07427.1 TrkA family potassium uptake protein [Ornithobacterium rhinotracheale]UOH78024.1 TrkA family potassium uptake protein [Ornithobacterium rhinotracheale]